jgi:hypothetical protein
MCCGKRASNKPGRSKLIVHQDNSQQIVPEKKEENNVDERKPGEDESQGGQDQVQGNSP